MKTGNPPDCAAYVLVGGRSSRMGQNKALLLLDGVPLAERVSRELAAYAISVTWIGDPEIYGAPDRRVIPDQFPGCGPLAGIHAALQDSRSDWNLVVACDMPEIDGTILKTLTHFPRADADWVVPVDSGGRAQPLLALYHRRCLPTLTTALQSGNFKVTRALETLRVLQLPTASNAFRNVNTPAEWKEFLNTHV